MQQTLDGRYEILRPLGSGGFGKTYLARDLRIPGHPQCVVKQLHCKSSRPQEIQLAQQLFQREAESLAQLGHHDQIPRLLAYFNENEEFYLVEDYIEGRSLDQEIRAGQPWSEAAVTQFLESLLDILAFVHSQNVIHRDIKPENLIRRNSDGKIVLIDFGAIKQVQQAPIEGQRTGTQIGTAGFMPPEQAQGKPRPNSDIYGVGMVAIAAITGHPAYGLPDDPQTGEVVWQQFAPSISPHLGQILSKMVRYHFQNRYQTVGDVLQDLRAGAAQPIAPPAAPIPAPNPISSQPTQVASPAGGYSAPNPQSQQSPKQKKGSAWLLGLTLAILIPVIGGAAALLFSPANTVFKDDDSDAQENSAPEICKATVNGNIRSERTSSFGSSNILRSGQGQSFEIGKRETRGGWIEIKLPTGGTAWTHLDVVSNENALKECLSRQDIRLTQVSDILPPPPPSTTPRPLPSPSTTPTPSPTPSHSPTPTGTPTDEASPPPSSEDGTPETEPNLIEENLIEESTPGPQTEPSLESEASTTDSSAAESTAIVEETAPGE